MYAHDVETYEEMLRDLKDGLVKDGLPQIYFCNAGTRMAQSDFEQGRLFASEVFVFVDREFVPEQLTATVPAGNYACIYCDSFYKEQEYIARLRAYIHKAGAACAGIICANLLQISPWPSQTPAGCTFGFSARAVLQGRRAGGNRCARGPKKLLNFYRIGQLDLIPHTNLYTEGKGGHAPPNTARVRLKRKDETGMVNLEKVRVVQYGCGK